MEYSTQRDKIEQLQQIKDTFYTQNKKNVFFKTDQKFHLAQSVCTQIDLEDLMYNTCWIIPNTNKVYFEYSVFKHYACPENYQHIVDKIHTLCLECVQLYGKFEVHINLSSFTISAAERYKGIIQMYCDQCASANTTLTGYLDKLCLYNIPTMIDNISRLLSPMVPPEVREKRQLFTKEVSETMLQQLHASATNK
jgi:hypothetical protein